MIHINKILAPVDFSEASIKAVDYGLSLSREFEARLVLAHVVPLDKNACEEAMYSLSHYRQRMRRDGLPRKELPS